MQELSVSLTCLNVPSFHATLKYVPLYHGTSIFYNMFKVSCALLLLEHTVSVLCHFWKCEFDVQCNKTLISTHKVYMQQA